MQKILIILFLFSISLMPLQAAFVSQFESSTEGWTFFNDGTNLQYVASGGNPGGYLQVTDAGDGRIWWFQAPTAWNGNWSSLVGGALKFDIKIVSQSGSALSDDEVRIYSGSDYAAWNASNANLSSGVWTHMSTMLLASNFTMVGSKTFEQVMSNVTQFLIRGEYISGADTEGLDNVMVGIPEPAGMILLSLGIFVVSQIIRKR